MFSEIVGKLIGSLIGFIISAWLFMLIEGAIAAPHHIYQVSFLETFGASYLLSIIAATIAMASKRAVEAV